jgi:hypothetical protein
MRMIFIYAVVTEKWKMLFVMSADYLQKKLKHNKTPENIMR